MSDPPTPLRVAVIDDDESVRFGLRALLEAQGYIADLFELAEAFLDSARPEDYVCIVLDLWLKGRLNSLPDLHHFRGLYQNRR